MSHSLFSLPGKLLALVSVLVTVLTLTSLPWLLGGVVPEARLLLICGAVLASVCSLMSQLLQRNLAEGIPVILLPLLGLALLGLAQLRQTPSHAVVNMHHAVCIPPADMSFEEGATASASPADTRSAIALLLALGLITLVGCQHLDSPAVVVACGGVFVLNAVVAAAIGFGQLFGQHPFELNNRWVLDRVRAENAFAGFVNPNNAAGWLLLTVAIAAGLSVWLLQPGVNDHRRRHMSLSRSTLARLAHRGVAIVARLTPWQMCAHTALVFLVAAVAATKSRSGILAMIVAVAVSVLMRNSLKRAPVVLLLVGVTGGFAYGLLDWLELRQGVTREMATLHDLETAVSGRMNHWMDTARMVADFPLLGTGLGSYRFATLPYQRRYTGLWHCNADNQYFEMLIEGGVIGLLLFLLAGLCCFLSGLAGYRLSRRKRTRQERPGQSVRVSRRLLVACGTTAVFAVVAQACCAAADFGIGLPAAGSLFALIAGASAGVCSRHESRPGLLHSGYVRIGRGPTCVVHICLIVAAVNYVPDQIMAAQIGRGVVTSHHLLGKPFTVQKMDQLNSARDQLLSSLEGRPDDPNGLWALARIADANFRWQYVLADFGSEVREDPRAEKIYRLTTLPSLARAMHAVGRENGSDAERVLQNSITQQMQQQNLERTFAAVQHRYPLLPRIALISAAMKFLQGDVGAFEKQVQLLQFGQPSNATQLYEAGAMALRCDNAELGQSLWHRSLELSEEYRAVILNEGQLFWDNDFLLKQFAPVTYATSVSTAMTLRAGELAEFIWADAEAHWSALEQPVSPALSIIRVRQLQSQKRRGEALVWLETASRVHTDNIELRAMYAQQLEHAERFRDSLQEWYHVQFLDPENGEAAKAIERIRNMK